MNERLDSLLYMGLPAAVLQALVPRSPSLAPPERPHTAAPDVDRFTSGPEVAQPDAVVTELRNLAELHQARQAANTAQAA
jgi:hypothetical protein